MKSKCETRSSRPLTTAELAWLKKRKAALKAALTKALLPISPELVRRITAEHDVSRIQQILEEAFRPALAVLKRYEKPKIAAQPAAKRKH